MAQELCVIVSAEDRARWAAIIDDRNRPLKHIQRAQIVLFSAERLPVLQVAHRAGVSRPAVWRWQKRYAEAGVEGLLRDKTRPPGRKPVPTATVAKVLALTQGKPFGEATHWTGRAMAKAVGLSLRTVQRIWETHRLQPHRIRTFKRSNDPAFAEKVEDVIGLYMHPPAHAVVLSIDEKSQIPALDRTQPGLPRKPGRCGTMTHDYKRHGTTTLFAALSMWDGKVIGDCMPRHRHQEFIRFLKRIDTETRADLELHLIVDNYATHKHPRVKSWLKRHARFHLHFIPTSSSWLNLVERWFRDLTQQRIRRASFHAVKELVTAITDYMDNHNQKPQVFVWSAPVDRILSKIAKCKEALDAVQ